MSIKRLRIFYILKKEKKNSLLVTSMLRIK